MPLGTTLGELVNMVRLEAGQSASPSTGRNTNEAVKQHIRRTYRRLHNDFHWPHLNIRRDLELQAGQRYYTLPAGIDFQRLNDQAYTQEVGDDQWRPLVFGIGVAHFNAVDSEADVREDPVRAWDVFEGGQIEVWPIPASNGGRVRFDGVSLPKPLVSEGETLDIDDDLVALYVSAEWLARQKSPEASMRLEQATVHYQRLKARASKHSVFKSTPGRAADMRVADVTRVRAPGT